jgi:hypothetical protein
MLNGNGVPCCSVFGSGREESVDGNRFDNLARNFGEQSSRRKMIKAAAGTTLAVLGMGAAGRAALGQGVGAEARGFRRDDCSNNANICRQGLECDPDTLTCEYLQTKSRRCGGKFRGKKGDDCESNSDCCRRKNLFCNDNEKCRRQKANN